MSENTSNFDFECQVMNFVTTTKLMSNQYQRIAMAIKIGQDPTLIQNIDDLKNQTRSIVDFPNSLKL